MSGARPGGPDPSISEKPRAPGTVCIHPPRSQNKAHDSLAVQIMQSGEAGGGRINWTFYSCLDAKTQPAHTPLRYSTQHISAACVHELGSCATHRPHTPTTLEHHLRVRFISRRSKALHVSESKLAHNDIIVWGPQGVKTQVHPKGPDGCVSSFCSASLGHVAVALPVLPAVSRATVHYDGGAGRW